MRSLDVLLVIVVVAIVVVFPVMVGAAVFCLRKEPEDCDGKWYEKRPDP